MISNELERLAFDHTLHMKINFQPMIKTLIHFEISTLDKELEQSLPYLMFTVVIFAQYSPVFGF